MQINVFMVFIHIILVCNDFNDVYCFFTVIDSWRYHHTIWRTKTHRNGQSSIQVTFSIDYTYTV